MKWNQVGQQEGRKEERKDRIKSVAFRHPTKPIHLTPNPVQPSPEGEAEWKGRGRFCSRTKIWQICRDLPKNGGEVHSATPLPRVPRILPTVPPLPQRGWRAKGWLLNYLDRTKRNKWRWIGPLMRYWPITATHVYWYRRIRAARLPPLPSLCILSFLSKNSPLGEEPFLRFWWNGVLFSSLPLLEFLRLEGDREIVFRFFNLFGGREGMGVSFPRFVKGRKESSSNYLDSFFQFLRWSNRSLSFSEWKCFLQRYGRTSMVCCNAIPLAVFSVPRLGY